MKYELAFIISPLIPETEHQKVYQEVAGYLAAAQAEVIGQPFFMGRKKLAYPIKKQKHGFYVFLEFNSDKQSSLKEFDVKLRHHTSILRHLIIKKDKAATGPLVDAANFNEKPALHESKVGTGRRTAPKRPVKVAPTPRATVERSEQEKLISLGEIDRKLDQILEQEPKLD